MRVPLKKWFLLFLAPHLGLGVFQYRKVAERVQREQQIISARRRTSVTRDFPPTTACLVARGLPVAVPEMREWRKLSLAGSGFETLERFEYVESGVRLSKGCYFFRLRPVTVVAISPRMHSLPDSLLSSEMWSRLARAAKEGPIAIVRRGEPPPYAHAFHPLIGAWRVHGWVPGRALRDPFFTVGAELSGYSRHYHVTTILDEPSIDQEQSAYYEARGTRACSRLP